MDNREELKKRKEKQNIISPLIHMFLKTNQGLGRTYRNKKRTKEQKQNPTQTKPKRRRRKKKKSHTSKDLRTCINGGLRETKESG